MDSFEDRLRKIVDDPELFNGQKKIAVLKAMAEEKCYMTPKRVRKLGEEVALAKFEKCKKRKIGDLWGSFFMQKQPVQVEGLIVQIKNGEVKIEKEEKSV
jgi:hypothetical protein